MQAEVDRRADLAYRVADLEATEGRMKQGVTEVVEESGLAAKHEATEEGRGSEDHALLAAAWKQHLLTGSLSACSYASPLVLWRA